MSGNDLKLQVLLNAVDRVTGPMKKIMRGTSDTARALKAAKDQLASLERQQGQLQGFRKLKNQVESSGLALKAAQQEVRKLGAAVVGVESPTRKATTAYNRATREVEKLKAAHVAQLRTLRDARGALNAAGIDARKFGENERRLATDIQRANALIDKQQAKLDRLGKQNQRLYLAQRNYQKSQRLVGELAGGGATMIGAGAAMLAPGVAAVKSFASFQDAMTGVARQVQGARDDAGKLTPLYYEMGEAIKQMSERLPGTAEDIAAIVEAGARMGIQGKKNLLVYAETTSVMADAFELPVDQVGHDISTIANLYKVPIDRIGELGDAINWLDDKSLASGADIIGVLKRIGGTADMVGMSYKQAAALASTFLSLGSGEEVAASASNAMIRELSIATMQAKRFQGGLKMLNLDPAAVQRGMASDSTGTILKVLDAIKALPKEQGLEAATRLFGKEFGDDAAKLAGNLAEYRKQLALVNDAQSKGSMLREAQARAGNLSAIWANAKDAAKNLASELGVSLAPAINDIMKAAAGMAQSVRAWVKENPALAGGILKAVTAAGALVAVIGGLALALGAVLGPLALVKFSAATLGIRFAPMLGTLWGLATKALPAVGNAILWVGRLMMANPIVLVLTLVAGLAYLVWKNWSKIGPAIAGMWESITIYAKQAWDGVLGFISGLWTRFQAIGGQLMQGLISGLQGGLKAVGDTINGIGEKVVGWFKGKLGIRSPSRVFAQLGDYTMQGLAGGLDRSRDMPVRALTTIAGNMRRAGAGVALVAASAPAVAIDSRAPLSPAAGAYGGGSAVYHITINAGAGSQAQDIAAMVRLELERIERERAARGRSRMGDRD